MAYFDLFSYPLAIEDVCWFLDIEASQEAVGHELAALVAEGRLFRLGAFYSLQNEPTLALKRLRGEARADELLVIASRGARLLYRFPFVRGVCISGSLSKRCADEKADIDYFIITRANRLWIARTLLHLFKKLTYLRGHQHRYCMNYFVDEEALEIAEKNMFTAIELHTLMPMCGNGGLDRFFEANSWTGEYLPHYQHRPRLGKEDHGSSRMKRLLEKLLDTKMGDRLDHYFRLVTDRRWQKKAQRGDVNMKGDAMSLQCDHHYCRPNPEVFQQRILHKYQRRVKEVMDKASPFTVSGKK
jgi:hypothetical protein